MAHVGLQVVRTEVARIAGDERVVATRRLERVRVAAGLLADVLVREHDVLVVAQAKQVLPGRLVAVGDEATEAAAAARQVVEVVRELHARRPERRELAAVVGGDDARGQEAAEVGRRVVGEGDRIEVAGVVARVEVGLEHADPDAVPLRRREAEAHAAGVARVSVVVGIEVAVGIVREDRGDAAAAIVAERERVVERPLRAGHADVAFGGSIAAVGRVGREARRAVAATGEDLHDAADAVGAVQA